MAKKRKGAPVVGVDLGGTKILAAVVDKQGQILGQSKRRTLPGEDEVGPEVVAERIVQTVQEAVSAGRSEDGGDSRCGRQRAGSGQCQQRPGTECAQFTGLGAGLRSWP